MPLCSPIYDPNSSKLAQGITEISKLIEDNTTAMQDNTLINMYYRF